VTVTYTLAPHVDFNTAVPSQGRCDFVQGTVTCALGMLATSAEATIDLQVTPLGLIGNELILSQNITVTAAQVDPNSGNSMALTATVVACLGDGDVNQDGSLTPLDAVLALQGYLGTATSPLGVCQQDRANVAGAHGDRNTPADARCIFQAALGMASCLTAP
jgi:hypothetical protein